MPSGQKPATPVPQWSSPVSAPTRNPSRLLGATGAVLGVLGLIVGVAAWFRAAPSNTVPPPVYSEQQVADAKKAVCDAFDEGVKTLEIAGSRTGDNPVEAGVVAVNTRLALSSVANYLRNSMEANVAAPEELVVDIRELSRDYENIEMMQLADATRDQVAPIAQSADVKVARIKDQCP